METSDNVLVLEKRNNTRYKIKQYNLNFIREIQYLFKKSLDLFY